MFLQIEPIWQATPCILSHAIRLFAEMAVLDLLAAGLTSLCEIGGVESFWFGPQVIDKEWYDENDIWNWRASGDAAASAGRWQWIETCYCGISDFRGHTASYRIFASIQTRFVGERAGNGGYAERDTQVNILYHRGWVQPSVWKVFARLYNVLSKLRRKQSQLISGGVLFAHKPPVRIPSDWSLLTSENKKTT